MVPNSHLIDDHDEPDRWLSVINKVTVSHPVVNQEMTFSDLTDDLWWSVR